ncbi:CvpA family protein [Candidatus Uhrbacteria bacterium]|nr:CvpA family protein [Candidatus Uhrbacteria bacterium]
MSFVDIILLIILGGFVLFGFWFGIIHTLGALVGTVAGAYVAGHYFASIAEFFSGRFGGSLPVWKIIVFIIVFTIVNRLVGLVFYLIEKIFKILTIIPFLKTINRLAGAVLGFAEGALVLGLILHVAGAIPVSAVFLEKIVGPSEIGRWLIGIARVLLPLLPEALRVLGLPPLNI